MTTDPDHAAGEPPASTGGTNTVPPVTTGDRIEMAGLSHPGKVRPNNEDVYLLALQRS